MVLAGYAIGASIILTLFITGAVQVYRDSKRQIDSTRTYWDSRLEKNDDW